MRGLDRHKINRAPTEQLTSFRIDYQEAQGAITESPRPETLRRRDGGLGMRQ